MNAYAAEFTTTDRGGPHIREYGLGFTCSPHLLQDQAAFHRACEQMRGGMITELATRGPMTVFRVGECLASLDAKTGDFFVTLRHRAGCAPQAREVGEGNEYPMFTPEEP